MGWNRWQRGATSTECSDTCILYEKSLAVVQDEQEMVRRERTAIEEIRELLTEMHQDTD